MAKRKADSLSQSYLPGSTGSKKLKASSVPALEEKKSNLLDDSDGDSDRNAGSSSDSGSDGGVKVEQLEFKINQDYAKRFEHNKKREELQRLEEKYQDSTKKAKGQYGDKYDEDSESSDDEEEDDEGILATEELDAQISDALNAIRSKDPRVYKTDVTFYTPIEEQDGDAEAAEVPGYKKQKPMHLSDYHRENLLKGHAEADNDEEPPPRTFAQEQEDLKRTIVQEMHAAAADSSEDEEHEDDGFLVPKANPRASIHGVHHSRAAKVKVDLDIASADKNPETFLSNFMAARAWVPSDGARFQSLESDDEEEDDRAEKFEEAYNLRFEDSKGSNEFLKSYARDVIAAKSVRREEPSGRKKQRDNLREKLEAGKKEREEERARLRRLKIEEAEDKLKKIKKAAGLRGKTLKGEEWADFLDDGWDDEKWESEMNKRFGEEYYAELEANSDAEDEEAQVSKKKVKKPKWDDDIDINDLIPEFDDEDSKKPEFTNSDSELSENEDDDMPKKIGTSKDRQQEKQAKKKAARLERKRLEELVDSKMDFDIPTKSKQPTLFRYRDTSPTSFGLTARDILMAPDASLNEFAGLKKMATFRDAEKKRKDKKKLGKKARLRQWRKETFGNEDGPEIVLSTDEPQVNNDDDLDIVESGRKKKKRSRKSKGLSQPA
ncbi:KRI1-like family C-terminal-domain-containing protein [Rhexocercosporidium sp. MPI-PUGE-AT-0058]|nr:KRI1-like family C-terminal-domain-containing protein [Rhexocercosporidium sp. MPI-PUGE-AT-0058]